MSDLSNHRIAILATDGVERVELEQPLRAVVDAGAWVDLLSIRCGEIRARNLADGGAEFSFSLPREMPPETAA